MPCEPKYISCRQSVRLIVAEHQYDKLSYTITNDNRVYETDSIGNKRYDKQSYRIEGDKILPTNAIALHYASSKALHLQIYG